MQQEGVVPPDAARAIVHAIVRATKDGGEGVILVNELSVAAQ
ncbi:hypothetical protein [Paenibacillus sp. 481]|nr:hypothetical protein [Paenibacillus sp. 481]